MPRTLPVQSRNQWFQRVEALKRSRKKRSRYGEFVVEGVRSLNLLHHAPDWPVKALLYAQGRPLSAWAREMLRSSRAGVHLELDPTLMDELSDKEEPSELLAVVTVPDDDPARLREASGCLYVLLDQPSRPGNLGAIVRACDGLGVDGLVVFGRAADPYDPQAVRAAAGSLFSLPVVRLSSWDSLDRWLDVLRGRQPDLQLVCTTAHGDAWPEDVSFGGPTIVVLGNETRGIRRRVADLCARTVSIPMTGSASSLNVACAATAILYEAARQRRGVSSGEPPSPG